MNISVEIEGFEVISSGTIIGVTNKPIVFKIEDLVFELVFKENTDFKEQKISTNVPDGGKKMIINFENVNNSLGVGNIEPLKLGFIGEKLLYLNYRTYSLADNAGKLLHYTWFLGKKEGGQNV